MHPGPIFTVFGQGVYLYGICMAAGLIACFAFLMFAFIKRNFNENAIDTILIVGVAGAALGIFSAMLFQAWYDYIYNPEGGFKLGGMTFLGGLIGGVVGYLLIYNVYVFAIAPHTKIKWLQNNMNAGLCDALPLIPIGIVIAHAFGRLGCFFAGCCYGKETDAWYGIKFVTTATKVVPTQLFECFFLILLAAVMIILFYKFKFNCNFGLYAVAYGIWRFLLEFVRDDYRGEFVAGLTPSQFWCIVMVIVGIGYFFLYRYVLKKLMKHPENQPPVREKKKKAVEAE